MTMAATASGVRSRGMTAGERKVIFASSLGTVFEWYDFYSTRWTASQIGKAFYSAFDANTQFIFALLTFSAGFLVRPFGALVFGRVGDLVGRKYTFLVTITIMGLSTFFVGLTPGYRQLGWLAPGDPDRAAPAAGACARRRIWRRGDLRRRTRPAWPARLLHLLDPDHRDHRPVPVADRGLHRAQQRQRGRIRRVPRCPAAGAFPILLSIILLGISLWIRLRLGESPVFQKMKDEGTQSKAPLSEAFGNWKNGRIAIIALFGLTAGQAVIWYGGQFYARIFLVNTLKVPPNTADIALIIALAIATVGFLFFGWLSDKIGRKPIILAGCLLGAVTYHFAFGLLTHAANPALEAALAKAPVTVTADPADCNVLFDPVGGRVFTSSCDVARNALIASSVNFRMVDGAPVASPR